MWIASVFLLVLLFSGCQTPVRNAQEATQARTTIKNASLSAEVQSRLTGDRQSNFARVSVTADGGTVELTGEVPSARQKQRAEVLAREVDGVQDVRNHLAVQE